MQRDLRRLADTKFDVIVVGAGFYGVTAAWDAAQRGLSVAIIDKDDFGAATSFNNLKTLHGGLRSLQALNFAADAAVHPRAARAGADPAAPGAAAAVRGADDPQSASGARWRCGIALAISDAVARDRNDGLPDPGTHLPDSRIVSRDEALRLNPVIAPEGVTGGAVWYDYQMHSTDRVTLSFLLSAVDAGACAANYVQAQRFLQENGRVIGVRRRGSAHQRDLRDPRLRGRQRRRAVGRGAACRISPAAAQGAPPPRLSRAMNVVTRKVVNDHACGGLVNGRYLFMVPWRDVSMLGTSHDAHEGTADQLKVSRWDLEAFLKDAREAFPHAEPDRRPMCA